MVIKKKATKTAKKATPKDSNRGRPKKEFKLRHKRIAETTTTTNHEEGALTIHRIPQVHKLFKFPSQDRSILYLFIFSIILFIFSVGVSFLKKQEVKTPENVEPTTQTVQDTTKPEVIEEEKPAQINSSAQQTLQNFYDTLSNKNFTEMTSMIDNALRYTDTIQTYFNTKRLTRFANNLLNNKITISNIVSTTDPKNPDITNLTYTLNYTLTTDNTTYTENRSTSIISRTSGNKIAKIRCETTGCSRMPFFNPGKYNLK